MNLSVDPRIYIYIYIYIYIGSIPDRVIPKTQKWYSLFNSKHFKVQIKGKWYNPAKGVAPSPTLRCYSYWKGRHRVALDNGRPTNIYIYIYIYARTRMCVRVPFTSFYGISGVFPDWHHLGLPCHLIKHLLSPFIYQNCWSCFPGPCLQTIKRGHITDNTFTSAFSFA